MLAKGIMQSLCSDGVMADFRLMFWNITASWRFINRCPGNTQYKAWHGHKEYAFAQVVVILTLDDIHP